MTYYLLMCKVSRTWSKVHGLCYIKLEFILTLEKKRREVGKEVENKIFI